MEIFTKSITLIIVGIIKFYQFVISPVMSQSCRHYPTCSEYSIESIKRHGVVRGVYLALKGYQGVDLEELMATTLCLRERNE